MNNNKKHAENILLLFKFVYTLLFNHYHLPTRWQWVLIKIHRQIKSKRIGERNSFRDAAPTRVHFDLNFNESRYAQRIDLICFFFFYCCYSLCSVCYCILICCFYFFICSMNKTTERISVASVWMWSFGNGFKMWSASVCVRVRQTRCVFV